MNWGDLLAYGIILIIIVGLILKKTGKTFPELVNSIINFFKGITEQVEEGE